MVPLSQFSAITQSSDKYISLKSSSSSLINEYADNSRDSFAIPYLNDYATYIWVYDLSSYPQFLIATSPLNSNTQLNKSVLNPYKTVSDLDKLFIYLLDESFAQSQDVLKLIDSVYTSFHRKEEFKHSAELHITYAFFVQDYRGAIVVCSGSQKSEIIKKLQTKQTKQHQTLILIFSFLFISLVLMIVLFIFLYIYIFISTKFKSAVDGERAFRRAIVVAELMNTDLDYSRYYMFEVLMVEQDGGTEVNAVNDKATGVTYPLFIELNQDYHQLYQQTYYNKVGFTQRYNI
ncbi:MAG: hypothetical protein EZS28_013481 [Streblomastix strix]|uniref:Uncharacterized protein n=1 Tax=Streblomastix strix TaxID=222440 RepID=A0A5J4W806_9EUKA|nr:MAG: hypothetical protein EZS28_013481 [Streblomastix strix]